MIDCMYKDMSLAMGILNDFFIAAEPDVQVIEKFQVPLYEPELPQAEIDLVMLCTLEAILTGVDWESIFDRDYINPIRDDGPDGPWIYAVSNTLVEALTLLQPETVHQCAGQWMETDDWILRSDACMEKTKSVLEELITLCRKTADEGKRLFLWTTV